MTPDAAQRATGEQIVEDAIMRSFIVPTMSGPEIAKRVGTLIDAAVAEAVQEREAQHRDQLAALRVTWEAKDRDLTSARMVIGHLVAALTPPPPAPEWCYCNSHRHAESEHPVRDCLVTGHCRP